MSHIPQICWQLQLEPVESPWRYKFINIIWRKYAQPPDLPRPTGAQYYLKEVYTHIFNVYALLVSCFDTKGQSILNISSRIGTNKLVEKPWQAHRWHTLPTKKASSVIRRVPWEVLQIGPLGLLCLCVVAAPCASWSKNQHLGCFVNTP